MATVALRNEWVILGEGDADCNFFRKLTTRRPGFYSFDIFPCGGNTKFGLLLEAIRADRAAFARLKGVLIVADSTDNGASLFTDICAQIRQAGGYGVPPALLQLGMAPDYPDISVMYLPDEQTPGGLETLLIREIVSRPKWVSLRECVESYFGCDSIETLGWGSEARDKAIFACMVAATNGEDPSKAASYCFKDPTPVIDVTAHCFDDVERRVKAFCTDVEAA